MYQLGTEIHITDESGDEFWGRVVGHGIIHREYLRWASTNDPYVVLLVEDKANHDIRVIAPDAVTIRVIGKVN